MAQTLVSAECRTRLSKDPELGGGNFLRHAMDNSPDVSAACLLTDVTVRDADGLERREFSLAGLDRVTRAWSAWYVGRGVRPRDRVAVYVRDSLADLLHFLALSQIGAIPVLINGHMDPALAVRHCRMTGAVGLLTDGPHAGRLPDLRPELPDLRWTQVDDPRDLAAAGMLPADRRYHHAAEDPVLICHSSGTTGAPKPVIWAHEQMMAGIRCHLVGFRDQPNAKILSALPQSHASAIGYAALSMLIGVPLVMVSGSAGTEVAQAIDHHRPTTVVAFSGVYGELAMLQPEAGDFETVESWVSIGDAAHKAHIQRLVQAGRHWRDGRAVPGSMFIDGLGASELGWGGVLSRITVAGTERHNRCIGVAQPYAEVVVLREDGSEAAVGEIGLLGVKSPTVTPGIWNDSDMTYRSKLRGYWLSGDMAYRDEYGRFYHLDRASDVIRTADGTAHSVLMEEILLAHLPQVGECAVTAAQVGGSVRPVAMVAPLDPAADPDALLRRANEVLRSFGQPELASLELADSAASIPLGPTGKVLKRLLRERFIRTEQVRS
jgi:acyl-coenzyme A synthetase/AMP-(fatty) acid ligase